MNYQDVTLDSRASSSEGASATIGLQPSSTLGMMYSYDSPSVTDQSSLLWSFIEATTKVEKPIAATQGDSGGGGLLWLMLALFGLAWKRSYKITLLQGP